MSTDVFHTDNGVWKRTLNGDDVLPVANAKQEVSDNARGLWDNKLQFLFSCVSLSVGLGNVWRFPYLVRSNGGGAFLIPYIILMVVTGAPLFLLELGLGQLFQQGSLGVWKRINVHLGGIGVTSTIASFVVGLYYNVIIAWCFYYLFFSFWNPLPYSICSDNHQNTTTILACEKVSSPTLYFWYETAQQSTSSIYDLRSLNYPMAGTLFLSWLIVYFCIMRGVKSSGKVVYFTAIFPYLILIVFLVRGITLKGSMFGLYELFKPDLSQLVSFNIWMEAATQVFFSLSLGFGSLIAFGSYNPKYNNCYFDSLFMCAITIITAILAAVDIYLILGHQAYKNYITCISLHQQTVCKTSGTVYCSMKVEDFLNTNLSLSHPHQCMMKLDKGVKGTGLTFIVFTQAIMDLPFPQFWSIAFFLMLLALGLGSIFGTMEGVITNMFDMNINVRKEILTGVMCLISFLIGLIFVTRAGQYWVGLFNEFASTYSLVIIGLLETIIVSYVYGTKRFSEEVSNMCGSSPGFYWRVCWRYISPIILILMLSGSFYELLFKYKFYTVWDALTVSTHSIEYPKSAIWFGLTITLLTVIPIVVIPLIYICKNRNIPSTAIK